MNILGGLEWVFGVAAYFCFVATVLGLFGPSSRISREEERQETIRQIRLLHGDGP
jgi:hypothetical protein